MNKPLPLIVETPDESLEEFLKLEGICMAEYALKDFEGHYFSYIHSVYRPVLSLGLKFLSLANIDVDASIKRCFPTAAVFSNLTYRARLSKFLNFFIDPVLANWIFFRDLSCKCSSLVNSRWLVLSVTADHSNLIGWAFWIMKFPIMRAPVLVLMLRFSYYSVHTNRWRPSVIWLKLGLWALLIASRGRRVIFAVDSEVLGEQYRKLTSIPIRVLPIPHTALKIDHQPNHSLNKKITFTSLGGVRLTKGFGVLAQAIQILHEQGLLTNIQFDLQCYQSEWGSSGSEAVDSLKKLNLPNVKLIETSLSEEEYSRLLIAADVVLIPFFRDIYYANTSGTFTEAVAAGKPVIVTEDTWMSLQLNLSGAGLTFKDQDALDLARAIREIHDNYENFSNKAWLNRKDWIQYHNPENFLRALIASAQAPDYGVRF